MMIQMLVDTPLTGKVKEAASCACPLQKTGVLAKHVL